MVISENVFLISRLVCLNELVR